MLAPNTLNTLLAPGTFGNPFAAASPATTPPKRRGWPLRHCRRVYWYRFHLLGMHQRLSQQLLYGPNHSDKDMRLYNEEEIATLKNIIGQLTGLYNNRFEAYKKMIAQEKGYEYIPSDKVNKFILK